MTFYDTETMTTNVTPNLGSVEAGPGVWRESPREAREQRESPWVLKNATAKTENWVQI